MSTDIRTTLIENGWKQGAIIGCFDDENFRRHACFNVDIDNIFLVISQTCDLINPCFVSEPFLEVLRLKAINTPVSPEYAGGKNSRKINFKMPLCGEECTFQAMPFERCFVDRQLLQTQKPDDHAPNSTIETIVTWLTRRFSRTAFPEQFNQRLGKQVKKIEKIIKKLILVQDIYIKLLPFTELSDDTQYKIEICLLIDANHYDDTTIYNEYIKLKNDLERQFNLCSGIDCQTVDLRSNADISVREIQEYKRWDYSYLTYRDPSHHANPAGEF